MKKEELLQGYRYVKTIIVNDIMISGNDDVQAEVYQKDEIQIQIIKQTKQYRVSQNFEIHSDLKKYED